MSKEEKAANSRQSVDLKWKERKGLEENVAFDGNKTEVGGDAEIDGALTLNSPSDLKTKDGSKGFMDLNTEQESTAAKTIGGVKIGGRADSSSSAAFGFRGDPAAGTWPLFYRDPTHFLLLSIHGQITMHFNRSGTVGCLADIPSVRHHLVFSADNIYACADLLTTPDHAAALTLSTLPALLDAPLTVSGIYYGAQERKVVGIRNESGVLYFMTAYYDGSKVQADEVGTPAITGLTLTDSVDTTQQAKEAPSWQDEEEEE